jgi:hypothetical protein
MLRWLLLIGTAIVWELDALRSVSPYSICATFLITKLLLYRQLCNESNVLASGLCGTFET